MKFFRNPHVLDFGPDAPTIEVVRRIPRSADYDAAQELLLDVDGEPHDGLRGREAQREFAEAVIKCCVISLRLIDDTGTSIEFDMATQAAEAIDYLTYYGLTRRFGYWLAGFLNEHVAVSVEEKKSSAG